MTSDEAKSWAGAILAILSPLAAFLGKLWVDKIRRQREQRDLDVAERRDVTAAWIGRLQDECTAKDQQIATLTERVISLSAELAESNKALDIAVTQLRARRLSRGPVPSRGTEKSPASSTEPSSIPSLPRPPRPPTL